MRFECQDGTDPNPHRNKEKRKQNRKIFGEIVLHIHHRLLQQQDINFAAYLYLFDSKAFLPYFLPMSTLTITAKGQVTLRKDLLKHLGVQPGETVTVNKLPDGAIEVRP